MNIFSFNIYGKNNVKTNNGREKDRDHLTKEYVQQKTVNLSKGPLALKRLKQLYQWSGIFSFTKISITFKRNRIQELLSTYVKYHFVFNIY